MCYESYYPTLSICNSNYKAVTLLQAQGFRLVTPDPFLVRGLGLGTRLSLGMCLYWLHSYKLSVITVKLWMGVEHVGMNKYIRLVSCDSMPFL